MTKYFFLLLLFSFSIFSQNIDEKWLTRFEKSNYLETPNYDETINYFKLFEKHSKYAKLLKIGTSPQDRDIYCLVVAKNNEFTPQLAHKSKKAIVLIENGIHAGEIEGKDACMLLLRDILITKKKFYLLDSMIIMVIPVINVDGHERISKYNRINQDGPINMGWRTTAQNYNLNRDFLKADAVEMKSLLKLFSDWLPDFFIDSHTTDGADFQYSILYAFEKFQNIDPLISNWLKNSFIKRVQKQVEDEGFLMVPYSHFRADDLEKGLNEWASPPRLSTGYAAAQNRPSLLIETHSLKPYKHRVFATLSIINASLNVIYENNSHLRSINKNADENVLKDKYFPISYKLSDKYEQFLFMGVKYYKDSSNITGNLVTRYSNEKFEKEIKYFNDMDVIDSVYIPKAYIIPIEFKYIIDILNLHGIKYFSIQKDSTVDAVKIKFKNVSFAERTNEGRHTVNYKYDTIHTLVTIPKGSFVVPTNQRTMKIILYLLDPKGEESFLKWGFFNSIFEQKEYFEEYSMEPIAKEMLKNNPQIKAEFKKRLSEDEKIKNSPYQRLNFFYEKSPYYDSRFNIYPILVLY